MFNLQRLQRFGIPCPKPVLLKKHILFLSFIGKDTVPAQRLRDVTLTPEELSNAYQQCLNVRSSSGRENFLNTKFFLLVTQKNLS